jgi:hypothetical protein
LELRSKLKRGDGDLKGLDGKEMSEAPPRESGPKGEVSYLHLPTLFTLSEADSLALSLPVAALSFHGISIPFESRPEEDGSEG